MTKIVLYSLLVNIFYFCSMAMAAENNRFGHVGLGLTNLTGSTNKSLSSNSQYSLELITGKGNAFASYLFKFRFDSSSGNAKFLDSGTSTSLSYSELSGMTGLGFRITPIATPREKGVLLYFGLSANLGFVQLKLPNQTYVSLSQSQSALSLGYDVSAGVEFIFGGKKNPWGVFSEIALKQQNANLAGQSNFSLGGLMLMGGITW